MSNIVSLSDIDRYVIFSKTPGKIMSFGRASKLLNLEVIGAIKRDNNWEAVVSYDYRLQRYERAYYPMTKSPSGKFYVTLEIPDVFGGKEYITVFLE